MRLRHAGILGVFNYKWVNRFVHVPRARYEHLYAYIPICIVYVYADVRRKAGIRIQFRLIVGDDRTGAVEGN